MSAAASQSERFSFSQTASWSSVLGVLAGACGTQGEEQRYCGLTSPKPPGRRADNHRSILASNLVPQPQVTSLARSLTRRAQSPPAVLVRSRTRYASRSHGRNTQRACAAAKLPRFFLLHSRPRTGTHHTSTSPLWHTGTPDQHSATSESIFSINCFFGRRAYELDFTTQGRGHRRGLKVDDDRNRQNVSYLRGATAITGRDACFVMGLTVRPCLCYRSTASN